MNRVCFQRIDKQTGSFLRWRDALIISMLQLTEAEFSV